MTFRLLRETLWHRKRRVSLVLLAVAVGASLTTALLSVSTNIAGKMAQELRSYGANIAVTPLSERIEIDVGGVIYSPPAGASYLDERELVKLKTIFWRNNILGFVPSLSTQVRAGENRLPVALTGTWFDKEVRLAAGTPIKTAFEDATVIREDISLMTGVKSVNSWWQISGNWPGDEDMNSVLVGTSLAKRLQVKAGDILPVEYEGSRYSLKVVGLLSTGGFEDDQIIASLPLAQKMLGIPYGASKVMVSAMVEPTEKLAPEIRNKKPEEMTPREYEIWYCSPIVEAVSKQIEEVITDSQARPVRQIAEAEGAFLVKIEWLIALITVVALTVSILGVMATLHTAILERRAEIGLMKALGAQRNQIATLFILEAGALGISGGILGYLGGSLLAKLIGRQVFDSVIVPDSSFLLIAMLLALVISLVGSGIPVWQATRIAPIKLMKG